MLTKYSLQKQLIIIFSIIAISILAILLPLIDNNLTHIMDNEMYDVISVDRIQRRFMKITAKRIV